MIKLTLASALVKAGLKMHGESVGQFGAEIKKLTPADRQWFADRFVVANRSRQQRFEDAMNYVRADKSDPFTFNRVMSHLDSRMCGFNSQGQDAFYSAEPYQEERFLPASPAHPEGQSYMATVYKNRVRP